MQIGRRDQAKETVTRLKMYRERIGLSQSELARESGVSVRMIQYYEQRRKDLLEFWSEGRKRRKLNTENIKPCAADESDHPAA